MNGFPIRNPIPMGWVINNTKYIAWLIACIIIIAISLATGVYLIQTEHYGWAWIPFVIAAFTGGSNKKDEEKGK